MSTFTWICSHLSWPDSIWGISFFRILIDKIFSLQNLTQEKIAISNLLEHILEESKIAFQSDCTINRYSELIFNLKKGNLDVESMLQFPLFWTAKEDLEFITMICKFPIPLSAKVEPKSQILFSGSWISKLDEHTQKFVKSTDDSNLTDNNRSLQASNSTWRSSRASNTTNLRSITSSTKSQTEPYQNRQYNGSKAFDLIRLIRNLMGHFNDYKSKTKHAQMYSEIGRPCQAFMSHFAMKFPNLICFAFYYANAAIERKDCHGNYILENQSLILYSKDH